MVRRYRELVADEGSPAHSRMSASVDGRWVLHSEYELLRSRLVEIRKLVEDVYESGYIDEGVHDLYDSDGVMNRIRALAYDGDL